MVNNVNNLEDLNNPYRSTLPVLKMYPIENIRVIIDGKWVYFIPEEWITEEYVEHFGPDRNDHTNTAISYVLSRYCNKTYQEYYDRWIKGYTVPSQRPKCEICGNEVRFINADLGYRRYCCIACSNKGKYHDRKFYKTNKDRILLDIPNNRIYDISELQRGYAATLEYFIPWTNEWISKNEIHFYLESIGKTVQEYYDRFYLNILDISLRPKCDICGKEALFFNISKGYRTKCKEHIDCTWYGTRGYYTSSKSSNTYHYRSKLELKYMEELDSDDNVIKWTYEEYHLYYGNINGYDYIVDLYIEYVDKTLLVEVKTEGHVYDSINMRKYAAAHEFCESHNMSFEIWTEYNKIPYEEL